MNQAAFQEQLALFPSEAVAILEKIKQQYGRLDPIQIEQLCQILQLSPTELLKKLMPLAAAMSTCPISGFSVGVIVEGYRENAQGPFYLGANMELIGQPLKMSIHAEQSAIANAWHQGENRLKRLFVNEAPCGHCRQFINELNEVKGMEFVVNPLGKEEGKVYQISDLLPDSFGPADLGQDERLLFADSISLNSPSPEDKLVNAATRATEKSYAPYSKCRSGAALLLENGDVVVGQSAENAAYNPGLTAVEAALVNLRLHHLGKPESRIVDAVMVETASLSSNKDTARSILGGYGAELRYYEV